MPYREMSREQMWMLPPPLDELLPPDHRARFVAEFVAALDREGWAELGVEMGGEPLGAPAYHPRALVSVWLYGFMTGVRSCRKLETACRDQIAYLWLTGWQHPDHNRLWRFYRKHRSDMRKLFERTVRTAVTMGLLDLAVQAVDGTKVDGTKMVANASKDRVYDAEELRALLGRLDKTISELEAQNAAGADEPAVNLPEELADKKVLKEQVRQAMDDLAGRGRQKCINLTDREARLMKSSQGIVTGYNAQAMVSALQPSVGANGMVVTAADVVDEPNDSAQLVPMPEQSEETIGARAQVTLADAGYHSGSAPVACARRDLKLVMPESSRRRAQHHPYHKDRFIYDQCNDSYLCPHGQTLTPVGTMRSPNGRPRRVYRASAATCQACPAFGVCTNDLLNGRALTVGPHDAVLRRHRTWMSTCEAQKISKRRKQLIEPVFGIIKEQQGARRFLLRSLVNVAAEWILLATAFNLRPLWRIWRSGAVGFLPCSTASQPIPSV